jgi:DNA-binding transcriptional LysR family regulator
MHYTLHQLQIFLKISQTKSVTKAAEELHLTQPAVSIQLKNFQEQFQIPLTELVGRKIYITDFGKEIAEAAENILNQVYAINYKSSVFSGQLAGRLKISVVSTGKYVMPYFLADFVKQHPGVDLVMDVTNKGSVVGSLENNEVDFALVSIVPNSLHVEKLDLLQNKLYLVGKDPVPQSNGKSTKAIFENLPLIFREKGSGTGQTMKEFIDAHKIPVIKKLELTSNEALKQALMAGMGYSIMPLIGIKNELQSGELKIVSVNELPIKTMWSLIWLKGKKHSPVADAYLNYLASERHNIVQTTFSWYESYAEE